jgi:acetyl esterase/lipase
MNTARFTLIKTFFVLKICTGCTQNIVNLYKDVVPGMKPSVFAQEYDINNGKKGEIVCLRNIVIPTLTVYEPKIKTSHAAILICPGGGYYIVAKEYEGDQIAMWFASKGITAFVLKYRLPQIELFTEAEIRPLQDAQQALIYIRKHSALYSIDSNKIGIMGFSAGGHLAAMTSNFYQSQVGEVIDTTVNVRPDFTILVYPVISFGDVGHQGSKENLIGKDADHEKIMKYSVENSVTPQTPPTFIVHAFDDDIHVDNSINYFRALKSNGVPSEIHIFDRGGHGFGLQPSVEGPVQNWIEHVYSWVALITKDE